MTDRRAFMAGLLAAGFCPRPTWAEAGSPVLLSAAQTMGGDYVLCGLDGAGQILFELPLPARGHAAAAHPELAEAVAFARRPGRFALVIDCVSGQETALLNAPGGRHFYGHGAFSADGALLFTTENDFEAAQGVIGIWDARGGYRRLGEFASGGVGPHEIRLMPDGRSLVVANGGIETHPDSGRSKLNLPTMRPNLTFLSLEGEVQHRAELTPDMHRNSIRHLAVAADGRVGFAMQWQGDVVEAPPLLGLVSPDKDLTLAKSGHAAQTRMRGYAGSVAMSPAGEVAITSPVGGQVQIYDAMTGALKRERAHRDVCGVAWAGDGFVLTSGTGEVWREGARKPAAAHGLHWDNHLVPLPV
ncbi:DUF1513 domain-containing protein [Antarctobacter jejuensis]|uniref:DUF1513 domain-containing protein n=1 Tax=Antarctobacter jejuensis TaxID=1439938 RepID=UPI003FD42159